MGITIIAEAGVDHNGSLEPQKLKRKEEVYDGKYSGHPCPKWLKGTEG